MSGLKALTTTVCTRRPRILAKGIEDDPHAYRQQIARIYWPFRKEWRTYVPKDHLRRAVKVTRAVRDAVGPEVDILVEVHRRLAPMHAIDLADALAEFEPYWFEEPCQSENVEALAEVRARSPIPIVTGETLLTRAGFRPVMRARRRYHQS